MERRLNRRYKRLKVDKRKSQNKNNTVVDLVCNKDEENFKIERFMKDVKRFYKNVESNEGCGNGLDLCEDKVKRHIRKEGFRGVLPKPINKGLIPPILSPRLNADLERMFKWANGRKIRKCNKVFKETVVKSRSPLLSLSDEDNSPKQNSSSVKNNEIEMKVDDTKENITYRDKSDLYIKFTHYVTKCLFNSGIDKTEMKSYSDSIKESLVDLYYTNKEDSTCNKILDNSLQNNSNMYLTPDMSQKTPIKLLKQKISECPRTSKSEDGPSREKFVLASDSQLSDDLVIRKSNQMMFASGLDYLKAVYSKDSLDSTKDLLNQGSDFSPIIEHDLNDRKNVSCSEQNNEYSFSIDNDVQMNDNDFYEMGNDYQSNHYKVNKDVQKCSDFNQFQTSDDSLDCDPSLSSRYFPDNREHLQNNKRGLTSTFYNDPYFQRNPTRSALINSVGMSKILYNQQPRTESPKYISLLPSNFCHQYCGNVQRDVNSSDSEATNIVRNNYCTSHKEIDTYLSIPVHPPQIKSPDIQFKPRRMF